MLTTVYLYNKYSESTSTDLPNDRLQTIIDDVSDLVEKKCGRVFGSATYKQWLDGDGSDTLFLPQYPINKLKKVTNSIHSAIDVVNSGSDTATISSNVSAISLFSIDTVGTETETDLYFATYANVSSMSTAINNVSTWTATAQNIPTNETSLMRYTKPIYAEDALGASVTIGLASSNISARIAYETNNRIEAIGSVFPCGRSNIYVEYDAGYTEPVDNSQHSDLTTTGDLPKGLTSIVNRIINDYLKDVSLDGNLNSFKLSDYQYTQKDISSIIDRHWLDLQEYARITP